MMHTNVAIAAALGALVVVLSPVHAQIGSPPLCSCSVGQDLAEASKPERGTSPVTIWNCLCGSSQCVIAHAPAARSELVVNCMSSVAKKEEKPVAPSRLQDKRGKSVRTK